MKTEKNELREILGNSRSRKMGISLLGVLLIPLIAFPSPWLKEIAINYSVGNFASMTILAIIGTVISAILSIEYAKVGVSVLGGLSLLTSTLSVVGRAYPQTLDVLISFFEGLPGPISYSAINSLSAIQEKRLAGPQTIAEFFILVFSALLIFRIFDWAQAKTGEFLSQINASAAVSSVGEFLHDPPINHSEVLYERFRTDTQECRRESNHPYSAFIIIQGGGAKGGWQGGFLNKLAESPRIKIKGSFGSSAGAINSWLISEKIRNTESAPFEKAWVRTSRFMFLMLILIVCTFYNKLASLFISAIVFALLLAVRSYLPKNNNRRNWILPRRIYELILSRMIQTNEPSRIFTYIQTTDISQDNPPTNQDTSHPLAEFRPGEIMGKLDDHEESISPLQAISISSSLPFIQPFHSNGRLLADGGIFSNLPLAPIFNSGSVGCSMVLVICATPIESLKADSDYIDHQTLLLIDKLSKEQKTQIELSIDQFPSTSLCESAIFIVQPRKKLWSGLIVGFLIYPFMAWDYRCGEQEAISFLDALENASSGEDLKKYLLVGKKIPNLPLQPPKLDAFWVNWLNFKWKDRS